MTNNPMPPDDKVLSQTDVVIQSITGMIQKGELAAGDRLPIEKDLAAKLGVSRGSLREGVRALVTLGVLDTRQGAGTFVTNLDADKILRPLRLLIELQGAGQGVHLLEVRRILEAESAAQAAVRITDAEVTELENILASFAGAIDDELTHVEKIIEADIAFHNTIARISGNPALAALIDNLGNRTARARAWRALHDRGALAATQAEHQLILAEIAAGNAERARIRMSIHIMGVEDFARGHADEIDRE